MDVLTCGHVAYGGDGRLCPHLLREQDDLPHFRLLRGRGAECDYICPDCEKAWSGGEPPDLVVACEGCVDRVESDTSEMRGWRGKPGILVRSEPYDLVDLGLLNLPPLASPRAIAPTKRGYVAMSADSTLSIFDGGWTTVPIPPIDVDKDDHSDQHKRPVVAVHASSDGCYAAVVYDYTEVGIVIHTASGTVLRTLERGGYHSEQTPFPCAFVDTPMGTALVAATAWNRVDAIALGSDSVLTERGPTRYVRGEDRPEHFLDYFHGALHASPSGTWILDDGWYWHPVGIPRVWAVQPWLSSNVWESEDGESSAGLMQRVYHWDSPMCWIDDDRLAIWGLGTDDDYMLAGITVISAAKKERVAVFVGPEGHLWSDGSRLFACHADVLTVWDPMTGERTATLPGVQALLYNRWRDEFVVQTESGLSLARLKPAPAHP